MIETARGWPRRASMRQPWRGPMPSSRPERREEARFRVMRMLENDPNISTREIAREVGISNGAAYYLLSALIEKGLVKAQNFSKSEQKTKYAYVLTPTGIAEKSRLTRLFLERKLAEYSDLKAEIAELKADLTASDTDAGVRN